MKKMVFVLCLSVCMSLSLCCRAETTDTVPKSDDEHFESLFDGTTLSPEIWQGELDSYKVDNGILVASPGGFICTRKEYDDYILRFEFKLPPAGNNGIGIRCAPEGSPGRTGMEIQILDDTASEYRGLDPTQYNGAIYGVAAPSPVPVCPVGEWNTEEIRVAGPQVTITINGIKVIDCNLENVTVFPVKGLVPSIHNRTGRLALAGHHSPVEFRNIRVLPLSEQTEKE